MEIRKRRKRKREVMEKVGNSVLNLTKLQLLPLTASV